MVVVNFMSQVCRWPPVDAPHQQDYVRDNRANLAKESENMDNQDLLERIQSLVEEEHRLRDAAGHGGGR
jgi:hypothetical protein